MRSVPKSGDAFAAALARVRAVVVRPEFRLDEAPAPARLAPSALALTAESADPDSDRASGRFVLLHDPDGVEEWAGTFRAVVFVRAALEHDLIGDPLLSEVGWSWLVESSPVPARSLRRQVAPLHVVQVNHLVRWPIAPPTAS